MASRTEEKPRNEFKEKAQSVRLQDYMRRWGAAPLLSQLVALSGATVTIAFHRPLGKKICEGLSMTVALKGLKAYQEAGCRCVLLTGSEEPPGQLSEVGGLTPEHPPSRSCP